MKHGIELNGVANIQMTLDSITFNWGEGGLDPGFYEIHSEDMNTLRSQLELLERYMIAYATAMDKGEKPPFWHDIKAEPSKYLTRRESRELCPDTKQ